jgi:hypothetical protein
VKDRLTNYIDRAAFVNPPQFTYGNAGRFLPENRGPGLATWDVSFARSFALRERARLMLRADAFNLFNRANFKSPATALDSAQFGSVSATEFARMVQLAIKLSF